MRKFLLIVIILGLGYFVLDESGLVNDFRNEATATDSAIAQAFENRKNGILAEGSGEVIRILSDDVDGDRHQRFILRLDSGQTPRYWREAWGRPGFSPRSAR